jgi:UDPglucose 6-dehydrogenase
LAVVGSGYVGLVSGACFAEMGNSVICVDIDRDKIEGLKRGTVPIFEPNLEKMVIENSSKGRLEFTTDIKDAIERSDIVFIAVGTPMAEDGSADLQYVLSVAESIGEYIDKPLIVVDKSTVPVGTADKVKESIKKRMKERVSNGELEEEFGFSVVSNPEFLKEGAAIEDFMKPDRVVIGSDNDEALEVMKELYRPFTLNHERFISMDIRSAELTKYASNGMLATKISFMNEIAQISKRVGADINSVRRGIGSDSRIGYSFIYPGCGFGGSCFPKDINALNKIAIDVGYEPKIIPAVEEVNRVQKLELVNMISDRFGESLKGFKFAIWGLSFKPQTDDMREAPSIVIIRELIDRGAEIYAYDPEAMEIARSFWLKDLAIEYRSSKYDVLNGTDAMVLVTEWKEFRSPDFDEMRQRLKRAIIFDGRNQYNRKMLKRYGFEYYQIGVAI